LAEIKMSLQQFCSRLMKRVVNFDLICAHLSL